MDRESTRSSGATVRSSRADYGAPGAAGDASRETVSEGGEADGTARRTDGGDGADGETSRTEAEVYRVDGGRYRVDGGRSGDEIRESFDRRSDDRSLAGTAVRWFTLRGERRLIVALLTLAAFVGLVGLGLAGILDVSRAGRVSSAFATTITGLFTLVTITVSINQLVLSRVLGSPEKIRDRIESVDTFREAVTEENDRVSVAPTEPAAFLEVVTRALRSHAERVADVFDDRHEPRLLTGVDAFVDEIVGLTEDVDRRLDGDRLRLIHVLLPVLGNRYSSYVHTVDRIRATTDDLSATEERALVDLREVLVEINQTRHYFKTLYIHEALSSLSLLIMATGVGAIAVCYVVILSYDVPASGAGLPHLLAVSATLAVALSPLAVLFAYGSRVAKIASQTTTFGTFTPIEERQ